MFTKKNTIQNLQNVSADILGTFTKMQNELKTVNDKIQTEVTEREVQIKRLQEEQLTLTNLVAQNAKVVNKLENFLKD